MNNYTERTWALVTISAAIKDLVKTYAQYPPRKLQSETYSGPVTLSQYERFQHVRTCSPGRASVFRCQLVTNFSLHDPGCFPGSLSI
jgi:hypothetical protein